MPTQHGTVTIEADGRISFVADGDYWGVGGDRVAIPPTRFPQTPHVGDSVNLHLCPWDPLNAAAAQRIVDALPEFGDAAGVLPPGHTIDPRNYAISRNLAAQTLTITYTANSTVYYVSGLVGSNFTTSQGQDTNLWSFHGILLTVPASAFTRTDWTNGLVAAIDASPDFPVEALAREAAHFDKAKSDFRSADATRTAIDALTPAVPTAPLRAALLSLAGSNMATCRDVEIESRRTAFARGVMAVIDRARTITDTYSVQDDAQALGEYVEAALTAIGGAEATEAMLRSLCTRMQDDLRSRTPTTFDRAKGAAVGAAVNAEEHATLTVHVHCLVSDVVGVPEPIDLISLEKKRFRLRADVADTGVKIKVPAPLAGVSDRSAVALELVSSGSTPLQRRFEGQTAWHAWINPTLGDLLVAGRNQTVWFRYAPKTSNDDA